MVPGTVIAPGSWLPIGGSFGDVAGGVQGRFGLASRGGPWLTGGDPGAARVREPALRLFFKLPPNLFDGHRSTVRQQQLSNGFEASRLPQPREFFYRVQHKYPHHYRIS